MSRRMSLIAATGATVAIGAVVGAALVVTGAAASLGLTSDSLGAASVSMPRCTTAGLGVTQNLSGSNVISVTVSNLPSSCGNATLPVAVNNGTASSSGSAAVPAAGGSVTVTLAAAVAVSTAETTDLVVLGP